MKVKILEFIVGAIVILSFSIVVSYNVSYNENIKLNEDTREEVKKLTGGQFVELSKGFTHYELIGNEDDPVVVLLHGGGPSMWIWDRQIEPLLNSGFRVLRFDRYGVGYSKRIREYSWEIFTEQLHELLDSLHIESKVHIAGRSLGGRFAACFATKYPDRVDKLAIISTSLLNTDKMVSSPILQFIPKYIQRVFGDQLISLQMNKYKKFVPDPDKQKLYVKLLKDQRKIIGTENAFSSIFSKEVLLGCPEASICLKQDRNITFIWGDKDGLVPESKISKMRIEYPDIVFTSIGGAGHGVNFTYFKEFNQAFLDFLKSE